MIKFFFRHGPLQLWPFYSFIPPIISFAVAPGVTWIEYPGLFFHLSVFFLVSILSAPEWGKAAGYGWILLDVLTGVLMINHVSPEIGDNVRLAGHIFAGIWIVSSSFVSSKWIKRIGIPTGVWLGGLHLCLALSSDGIYRTRFIAHGCMAGSDCPGESFKN